MINQLSIEYANISMSIVIHHKKFEFLERKGENNKQPKDVKTVLTTTSILTVDISLCVTTQYTSRSPNLFENYTLCLLSNDSNSYMQTFLCLACICIDGSPYLGSIQFQYSNETIFEINSILAVDLNICVTLHCASKIPKLFTFTIWAASCQQFLELGQLHVSFGEYLFSTCFVPFFCNVQIIGYYGCSNLIHINQSVHKSLNISRKSEWHHLSCTLPLYVMNSLV